MKPTVAAVILHYGPPADTVACVSSLRNSGYPELRILVVDNGSREGPRTDFGESLPECDVLVTGRNLGFAAGNNEGMRQVLAGNPEFVLVLNNDTLVEPGFLDPLVRAVSADPQCAGAGGTVCLYPETDTLWYAGGDVVPWRGTTVARRQGRSWSTLAGQGPETVSFLTGCMMLLKAEVLRRGFLFDEQFFLYFEDAELSARLVHHGYTLLYVPQARLYHKAHHTGDTPLTLYFSLRNRLLFIQKALPLRWQVVGMGYVAVVFAAKISWWAFTRPDLVRAAGLAVRDFIHAEFGEGHGLALGRGQAT